MINTGYCYAEGTCIANGATPPGTPCFECKTDVSQSAVQGPNFANHCYIENKCIDTGKAAPKYHRYNSNR